MAPLYNLMFLTIKCTETIYVRLLVNDCYKLGDVWSAHRIADNGKKRSDEEDAELREKACGERLSLAAGVQNFLCTLLLKINDSDTIQCVIYAQNQMYCVHVANVLTYIVSPSIGVSLPSHQAAR